VEHVRRVRSCLQIELPSCHFDEEVIHHFATVLEDEEALSQEALELMWAPLLIAGDACQNYEDASLVCARLLRRLQEQCVDGIDSPGDARPLPQDIQAWLELANLTQYSEETRQWCETKNVSSQEEMLKVWEELRDALPLKRVEKQRFEKFARQASANRPQADGAFGPAADRNRYLLAEERGRGATAKVYRCTRGNDVYAVKVVELLKSRSDDKQRKLMMAEREVKILQELRHEKIVNLIEIFEEPGVKLYMVMEYMPEGDLFKWIQNYKAFNDELSRSIFLQVVDGLKYMHEKNVIHRDLKPENILVKEKLRTGDLQVKLSDFGHSKLIDGISVAATWGVGTPEYLAPEVRDARKAKKGYNHSVDLWSLGVLLFVMLHGVYPFQFGQQFSDASLKEVPLCFKGPQLKGRACEEAQDLIRALVVLEPSNRLPLTQCEAHRWCWVPPYGATPGRVTG